MPSILDTVLVRRYSFSLSNLTYMNVSMLCCWLIEAYLASSTNRGFTHGDFLRFAIFSDGDITRAVVTVSTSESSVSSPPYTSGRTSMFNRNYMLRFT